MNPRGTPANLKPWPPGVSGNPSGRPKKKPLTEQLERLGPLPIPGDERGRTYAQAAAEGLLLGALAGDASNFREAADRLEGKVTDKVQHSGAISLGIAPARVLTPDEWLKEHAASQLALAAHDMGLDPEPSEPN